MSVDEIREKLFLEKKGICGFCKRQVHPKEEYCFRQDFIDGEVIKELMCPNCHSLYKIAQKDLQERIKDLLN